MTWNELTDRLWHKRPKRTQNYPPLFGDFRIRAFRDPKATVKSTLSSTLATSPKAHQWSSPLGVLDRRCLSFKAL